MNAAVVQVDGLIFDYPTQRALFGVDCRVDRGTITALVGPNGAGKTTLMRCMAGLEMPFAGSVVVAGLDVLADPRRAHKHMGFLQDFFGLYDDLSVRHCLEFHAAANGIAPAGRRQAVERTAERLNLRDRLDQRAGTLSRGLRQRLAIAQAIIHEPDVVLLDEPAAGLDPEARESLSQLLRTLSASGMTLIVSSHILSELEDYSTHMLILRDGRVVEHCPISGEPAALRQLRLVLSEPVDDLAATLAARHGVDGVLLTGATVASFGFAGDLAAQRRLLADLIGSGLPVAGLAEEVRPMQQVYRDRLRKDGPQANQERWSA
ncbi:MAG: ABC transporter ATP-binding protein [Rhodospirillaceae bacterium]|nr:ABC transporter ATP-binding protein [Rhodospirillaceae bacterium]